VTRAWFKARDAQAAPLTHGGVLLVPTEGWVSLRLGEFWVFRELLYFLVWRDVMVRYKQAVLGAAWAIIQPVATMIVFTVVFGRLAGMPSDGLPYSVFTLTALIPWTLFATALTQAGNSMVSNQNLVAKVYFPRLIIPLAAALAALVDFLIAFVVLIALMTYYRVIPDRAVLALPYFVSLAVAGALAAGIWLAALNVRYRDVKHMIPFLVQFGLFVTPVAYASSIVPQQWRVLYGLNPMVGVVDGFRWCLLGAAQPPMQMIGASTLAVAILLVTGIAYFRRVENTFADVI